MAVMEQAGSMLQQLNSSILARMESKVEKTLAEAHMVYRDEALKECVRRMGRALGRGPRRKGRR